MRFTVQWFTEQLQLLDSDHEEDSDVEIEV